MIRAVASPFAVGQAVHTPLGKGVVRELRNSGRLLVEINGRALVVPESAVSTVSAPKSKAAKAPAGPSVAAAAEPRRTGPALRAVDLHGLTVADALARAEHVLNDAMLADFAEVRFIHGRTGGRIRAALHRRLAGISSVRSFAVDPSNDGVTVVHL